MLLDSVKYPPIIDLLLYICIIFDPLSLFCCPVNLCIVMLSYTLCLISIVRCCEARINIIRRGILLNLPSPLVCGYNILLGFLNLTSLCLTVWGNLSVCSRDRDSLRPSRYEGWYLKEDLLKVIDIIFIVPLVANINYLLHQKNADMAITLIHNKQLDPW